MNFSLLIFAVLSAGVLLLGQFLFMALPLVTIALAFGLALLATLLLKAKGYGFFLPLFTCTGLGVLMLLGSWQLQRLEWKEALLTRMESQLAGEPLDLAGWNGSDDLDYRRVALKGRFLQLGNIKMLSRVHDGKVGWHLIQYFEAENGRIWLVNRGWLPDGSQTPLELPDPGQITGIARKPHPVGRFTPANNASRNQWYSYNPRAMFNAVEIAAPPMYKEFLAHAETRYVIEQDAVAGVSVPQGGVTQLQISNNHLAYAFTWFSLAIIMLVIASLRMRKH